MNEKREPGWYWVYLLPTNNAAPRYWDGSGWNHVIASKTYLSDDNYTKIGPRIEEPKP